MKKKSNLKNKGVSKKTSVPKVKDSLKKEVNKETNIFKNINLKQNIIIILLIAILVLAIAFVSMYTTNLFVNKILLNDYYNQDKFVVNSIEVVDIPVDTVNNTDLTSMVNDLNLDASELINEYLITNENKNSLESRYYFLFNKDLIFEYDFFPTEVGDSIIEYRDYIVVYNKDLDLKKSVWNISYIE